MTRSFEHDALGARKAMPLNVRLRIAWLTGLEEGARRDLGRPLTDLELRQALWRYPGDPPARLTDRHRRRP